MTVWLGWAALGPEGPDLCGDLDSLFPIRDRKQARTDQYDFDLAFLTS